MPPSLLARQVVSFLAEKKATLTTAESCTGGLIAAAITDIPGASQVFRYGWVTYCNEAKIRLLGVPIELIETYTVVSEPVVLAMAAGALERSGAHYALAVSGNAGPSVAPGEPPVGTVCIALSSSSSSRAITLSLPNLDRNTFRNEVVHHALRMLLPELGITPSGK